MPAVILVAAWLLGGKSASSDECGKELSPDEIAHIVDGYLEETFGISELWAEGRVEISRDECDYVYSESSTSNSIRFGDWFTMTIDQNGNVIDFQPGY